MNRMTFGTQSLITLGGLAFTQAAIFILTVVTARHLGAVGIARYQLAVSTLVMITLLAKLGLDEALAYRLPHASGSGRSGRRLVVSALAVTSFTSCLTGLATTWAAPRLEQALLPRSGVAEDFATAWPLLPALSLLMVAAGALRGFGRSDVRTYLVNYAVGAGSLVGLALAARDGLSLREAYGVRILPIAIAAVAAAALALRLGAGPHRDSSERVRLFAFGRTALAIGIAQYALEHGDILMGGLVIRAADLGPYVVASKLGAVSVLISNALGLVMGPALAAAVATGNRVRFDQLHRASSQWLVRGVGLVGGVLIALRGPLASLFGADQEAVSPLLVILAIGHLVAASTGLNLPALLASGRERVELVVGLLGAAAIPILALLLAPHFGSAGLAMGMSAAMVGSNLARALLVGCPWRVASLVPAGAGLAAILVAEELHAPAWVRCVAFLASYSGTFALTPLRREALDDAKVLVTR